MWSSLILKHKQSILSIFLCEQAAEAARMNLYGLRAETAAVESSGQAKAEAEVRNDV